MLVPRAVSFKSRSASAKSSTNTCIRPAGIVATVEVLPELNDNDVLWLATE